MYWSGKSTSKFSYTQNHPIAYGNNVISSSTISSQNQNQFLNSVNIAGTTYSLLSISDLFTDIWILDTGATNHMCCKIDDLQDLNPLVDPITVKFPNGDTSLVTHTGSIFLHRIVISITEVLLVPSFKFNLLSISKLASQTKTLISFDKHECILQDLNQKNSQILGKLAGGLYQFINSKISISAAYKASSHSL